MADGANNDVVSGIRTVGGLINTGRLLIHERCHRLREELAGYLWDSKKAERGEDDPVKKDDHAVDPLRYVLHTVVGKPGGMMTFSGVDR
jgi:phage terminase large subunit